MLIRGESRGESNFASFHKVTQIFSSQVFMIRNIITMLSFYKPDGVQIMLKVTRHFAHLQCFKYTFYDLKVVTFNVQTIQSPVKNNV